MSLQALDSEDKTNFFPVPLENGVGFSSFAHIKELFCVIKRDVSSKDRPVFLIKYKHNYLINNIINRIFLLVLSIYFFFPTSDYWLISSRPTV